MSLFLYEVKKLFSWKILLLIFVVNILLFKVFLAPFIEGFPNEEGKRASFEIEKEIIPLYGSSLDKTEYQDLVKRHDQIVAESKEYLANFHANGGTGFLVPEKYQQKNIWTDTANFDDRDLLYFGEVRYGWFIQGYEGFIEKYEVREKLLQSDINRSNSEKAKQLLRSRLDNKQFSIYTSIVLDAFQVYAQYLAMIIFINVVLVLSLIFIRDKRANIVTLQYTSKSGRIVYRTKWLAGLVSAVFLTMFLLGIYMVYFFTIHPETHLNLPLYTFNWQYYWFDVTLLQYMIINILLIFILAILLGVLTMAISNSMPNLIGLIAIQILVLFVMISGYASVIVPNLFSIDLPKYLVHGLVVGNTAVVALFTWMNWKHEMKKDLI